MNHEFDEELKYQKERRSRRNPKMQEDAQRRVPNNPEDTPRRTMGASEGRPRRTAGGPEDGQRRTAGMQRDGQRRNPGMPEDTRRKTAGMQEERQRSTAGVQDDGRRRIPADSGRKAAVRQTAAAAETSSARTGSGLSAQAESQIRTAKRRRRIIAMIIAECFALVFIFSYAFVAKRWNSIQRPDFNKQEVRNTELPFETVEKMKGYWTIAIFGVDDRGKIIEKSTNADVNMICQINMDTGEMKLVSVFRDSYLNTSEGGSYNKLNQAYFTGGPQQAVSALNRNLDLDITHYVTFNWKAVADVINILGGVDLEISNAEFAYINSFITETVEATGVASTHVKSAGMNHLDGIQAVAYARLRKMDTDFARTERQRKVIALAFEKAKKADIGVLNNIAEVVFEQVATNIELKDVIYMAMNISKYYLGDTIGFPMARGDANMGKKGAVVVPQTLESNVVQLHKFLYGDESYMPTSTVKNISAKIAADTGMYKEGRYIDKVPTDQGVVQPPKKTASESTKASGGDSATSESRTKETDRETDENGNYITKPETKPTQQTDANGNIIKETTGGTGSTLDSRETTGPTKPGSTMPATEGRPGPTDPSESSPTRPTGPTESSAARPGTGGESTAPRPGTTAESTTSGNGPGGAGGTSPGVTPGTPTTSGSGNSGPGGSGGTSATVPAPGGSNTSPTSPTVPATTGSSGPGGQNSEIPQIAGPGA